MTFNLRLAKSIMEQEDGMNHLWIQLFLADFSTTEKAEIGIQLPSGLYRTPNLNGYEETESKGIFLDLSQDKDVLFELYTQSAVSCGEAPILISIKYLDSRNRRKELSKEIVIRFVSEEEMDALEIDQMVIERVLELGNGAADMPNPGDDFVNLRPRTHEIRNNEYAYLEEKYRVEFETRGARATIGTRDGNQHHSARL